MTLPTTFTFGQLLIEIGDGATPEVFGAPCGLTSKNFNGQADTNDVVIPDCDDPDAPAWKGRSVTSLSRDISGSGVTTDEYVNAWDDWFVSGLPKNCRATLGSRSWIGSYYLTQFNQSADVGDIVKVSVAMQSSGAVTRS